MFLGDGVATATMFCSFLSASLQEDYHRGAFQALMANNTVSSSPDKISAGSSCLGLMVIPKTLTQGGAVPPALGPTSIIGGFTGAAWSPVEVKIKQNTTETRSMQIKGLQRDKPQINSV